MPEGFVPFPIQLLFMVMPLLFVGIGIVMFAASIYGFKKGPTATRFGVVPQRGAVHYADIPQTESSVYDPFADSESFTSREAPNICYHCGATLDPSRLEWVEPTSVRCPYCKEILRVG